METNIFSMSKEKRRHAKRNSKMPPAPYNGRHSKPPANMEKAPLSNGQERTRGELARVLQPALDKEKAEEVSLGIVEAREDIANRIIEEPQNAAEIVQRYAREFSGNGFNVREVIDGLYAYKYNGESASDNGEEKVIAAMMGLDELREKNMKTSAFMSSLRQIGFRVEATGKRGQHGIYWEGKAVRSGDGRQVTIPMAIEMEPRYSKQIVLRIEEFLGREIESL